MGQLKSGPEYDLFQQYKKRLSHVEIIQLKQSTKEAEEKFFLKHIRESDCIIGLDEQGKDYASIPFAQFLAAQLGTYKNICFLIGGADGLSDGVRQRCHHLLSFGKLTWPHMLVRGMLMEQMYRATLILNGHPYHRE